MESMEECRGFRQTQKKDAVDDVPLFANLFQNGID